MPEDMRDRTPDGTPEDTLDRELARKNPRLQSAETSLIPAGNPQRHYEITFLRLVSPRWGLYQIDIIWFISSISFLLAEMPKCQIKVLEDTPKEINRLPVDWKQNMLDRTPDRILH